MQWGGFDDDDDDDDGQHDLHLTGLGCLYILYSGIIDFILIFVVLYHLMLYVILPHASTHS